MTQSPQNLSIFKVYDSNYLSATKYILGSLRSEYKERRGPNFPLYPEIGVKLLSPSTVNKICIYAT